MGKQAFFVALKKAPINSNRQFDSLAKYKILSGMPSIGAQRDLE